MATYYSDLYHGSKVRTACETSEGGMVRIRGRVEVPVGKAPATGDVLKLFRNPAYATILRIVFANNDWGTDVPADTIGTTTDPNGIADTDLALGTARGITTLPQGYVNDMAGTTTSLATAFAADLPAIATDEDVYIAIGTASGGSVLGCWLSFAAELFVPNVADVNALKGTTYTWNGESAGLGVAST